MLRSARRATVSRRLCCVGVGLILLAACGGTTDDSELAAADDSPTGTPVAVTATDYAFDLPSQGLAPGRYTFVIDNAGEVIHAMSISGPGIELQTSETIRNGEQTQLTATLRDGTYELWCPVGGHRDLGMEDALTVGA